MNKQLIDAASEGDYETVHSLLQRNANVDFQDNYNNTALHHASVNGVTSIHTCMSRWLVSLVMGQVVLVTNMVRIV